MASRTDLSIMAGLNTASLSATTGVVTQAPEFPYFPKLPIELRFAIWNLSLPGPRILHLRSKSQFQPMALKARGRASGSRKSRLVSGCAPPVNLWVCSESRSETLREYKLAFGTKTSPAQTYVSFKIDTVLFDRVMNFFPTTAASPQQKSLLLREEFRQLRHLALMETFTWAGPILLYEHFPSLQTIELVTTITRSQRLNRGVRVFEKTHRTPIFTSTGRLSLDAWYKNWIEKMEKHWASKVGCSAPRISHKVLVVGS